MAREASRLHDAGVKILIAVGHAGYDVDMKVAKVPYIDLVVGGHTNTFLYSGKLTIFMCEFCNGIFHSDSAFD